MASFTTPSVTVESLTGLREAADNLLRYVSFPTQDELREGQKVALGLANAGASYDSELCQQLLGSSENIPNYAALNRIVNPGESEQPSTTPVNDIIVETSTLTGTFSVPGFEKTISAVYHRANALVDLAGIQSDISSLFCNLVPPVEMSLCVPYFDARIIYPRDRSGVGSLSPLRFVGLGSKKLQNFDSSNSVDTDRLIGFDVAGMEIFCMPQTLVGDKAQLNSPENLANRGLEVLDPLVPLMTIESANIQQTGVGGSLYAQTKVDLSIVLHDRSRLSDIEPLISVEVFPTLTFQIEYGWSHPDTNKMTGGAYAKLLNAMRSRQQFSLYSVSISTRDATSLKVNVSLISKGAYVSNNAAVVTAGEEYIPYTAVQSLLRQFVNLTTKRDSGRSTDKNAPSTVTYSPSKVGTSIIASTSGGATSNKFVNISDFYNLVKEVGSIANGSAVDKDKIEQLTGSLNAIDKKGPQVVPANYLVESLKFSAGTEMSMYGENLKIFPVNPKTLFNASSFNLSTKINEINQSLGIVSFGAECPAVPLVSAVAQLVAKPILLSIPDIDEVRIHCFSFNKTCGVMAGENIGNFPIVIKDLLEERDQTGEKITRSGLSLRSTAQTALNKIIAQVNSPGSRYFGFGDESIKLKAAVDEIKEKFKQEREKIDSADVEAQKSAKQSAQDQIDAKVRASNEIIQELNKKILSEKNLAGTGDVSFTPPRVKIQMDTLGAYSDGSNPGKADKNIVRIIIYDERAGGHNDLGNLIFSMANTSGLSIVDKGISVGGNSEDLFQILKSDSNGEKTYGFKSRQAFREIASKLYPNLIVGSEGSNITSANFNSQPSGEVASSYLLTALQEGSAASILGDSTGPDLADDVVVIPSSITLNMLGNVCMSRGQVYYVDFSTGTTLDNAYAVQSVSHSIRPGSFTTTATLIPTNSATMRSATRQLNELSTLLEKSRNPTSTP